MALVVGAAVLRSGTLLAARRTTPPEAAGRWELPGGKVELGESLDEALVREIGEELACRIAVESWIDGEQPIGATHVLRAAICRLEEGEPRAGADHDELRWLTPEELDDVDWLEPDRPFLAELAGRLLDGERLPGGNVGGAVRIGATVRRPTGPWTPAVHALLTHLHATGLRAVPRVHGIDVRGREVLEFLPGEVIDVDTDVLSDARLADLGRWTHELHDAQRGFEHPGPWRFDSPGRHLLIAHNDLGAYNVAFAGDRVAGVFDWDVAAPGTVLFELAQIAWSTVPLFRPVADDLVARRLGVLATAYDGPTAVEILAAVPDRVRSVVAGLRAGIDAGDPSLQRLAALGEPGRTAAALDDFLVRLPDVEAALARA
jgi:8-oxo-dGTP diphosphatase